MWWYLAALVSAGMVYGCSRYLTVANPKDGTPKWAYIGGIIVFAFGTAGMVAAGVGSKDVQTATPVASDAEPAPIVVPEAQAVAEEPKLVEAEPAAPPVLPPEPEPYRAQISEGAYDPITKGSSPKTYNTWGKLGIDRINTAMKGAVDSAAMSSRCDRVTMSGLAFDRSKPKDKIVVFADCANGERFYLSEDEITSRSKAVSVREKIDGMGMEPMRVCRDLIKRKAKHSSTVSFSMWSDTIKGQLGDVLEAPFSAKNTFGLELSYIGYCQVSDDGTVTLMSIKED